MLIDEQMQALYHLVQAGYVRYVGMSSCHAYQLRREQPEQRQTQYADNDGTKKIIDSVERVAKKHNASMAQVSLASLVHTSYNFAAGVTASVVGTISLSKLNDILGAVHVK
ncbi:hypothetical protein MD484_g6381, partial [Candolleomyces efflorescens]